jgi:serine/threonine protein kinase
MEDYSKANQFKLVQSYSPELFLCEKINSGLIYTVKHVDSPSSIRIQNLRNELKFLKNSKLYHPNIISLLWAEETANSWSIFYEHCNGGPLSCYSKIEPLYLFSQICQGVSYLHNKSIVHKNLTIHNIFLHNNIPKLSNFELSEKTDLQYPEGSILECIENNWVPPEVQNSSRFTKESDIWNLGLIFYFLVYREPIKFPLREDPRPQYRDIFSMTLCLDPSKRANIDSLIKKVNERFTREPPTVGSCACFSLSIISRNSTTSLVKKILCNQLTSTNDKQIEKLVEKVVPNPKKSTKFFTELIKQTEEANLVVKIRACTVLFCYLKDVPLVVYNQKPGVLEFLSSLIHFKSGQREVAKVIEVVQSFSQVIQCKFYLIRSTLPRLSGSFKVNESTSDMKVETLKQLVWYWDYLLNLHELLLAFGSANDYRIIRLAVIEEQVNVCKLLFKKSGGVQDQTAMRGYLENLMNNVNLAKGLFKEDQVEFPDIGFDPIPLIVLDDSNSVKPSGPRRLPPRIKRNPSQKFTPILLDEIEEDRPPTIYGTPLRSNSSLNYRSQEIDRSELLPPSLNQKLKSTQIDHKELKYEEKIGSGSSCEVWLGVYKRQKVAIKKQKSSERQAFTEFYRELNILMSLKHEFLIFYLGACLDHPLSIVTEYCEGGDLFNLLHRKPAVHLSWWQKIVILKQIAEGMKFLHQGNIIHRDLKSLNVLLKKDVNCENDEVLIKISDFGLSKVLVGDEFMTGQLGTCHWMAPEVLKSTNYSLKADVYSFAVVMFEVLTRNTPYRGLKQEEIRTQVVNFGLRPNVELVSQECPKTLRSLMVLCWSENPDDRPCFEKIADILDTVKSQKK